MTESLSQNSPEHNPADSKPEQEVFVVETITADEHNQIGELARQQHDEKILAKQADVSEALSAVNAAYGENVVDSYQDANGRTWVEDSQGRHTMLKETMAVTPNASTESQTTEAIDVSSPASDDTVAHIEKLIDESKAEQEQAVSEQEQKDGEPYDEKAAIEDLAALGLDEKAADLILDVQHNFQKKEFNEFLDPEKVTKLMERVGLPRDRQDEFTAALEKVHMGLYPKSEQHTEQPAVSEVAVDEKTNRSEVVHDAQSKLAKLSRALADVGAVNSGRLDPEIKRDADRIIQEAIETITNELRAKMKRGEEISNDDPLRRAAKYLRDIDTRFNAYDTAMRLQRINRMTGYDIDNK